MRALFRIGWLAWAAFVALGSSAAAEEVAAGRLLIATDAVRGTVFGEAVIFLTDYGPEGAVGLIVNRPLGAPLTELLPGRPGLEGRSDRAWLGGPVSPDGLLLLVRAGEPIDGARTIVPGIQTSRSATTLDALLAADEPPPFRAYVGYSGWGPRQLDAELARGAWIVAPASEASVFPDDPARLWQELLRRFQPVRVLLPYRG